MGSQKKNNYALDQNLTKEQFLGRVTQGVASPPQYFGDNVRLNKQGYTNFEEVLSKSYNPLDVESFKNFVRQGAYILDVRSCEDFCKKFIPTSVFVGLQGSFAPWVGTIVKGVSTPILLVADQGRESEAITRLSRVGYDNCLGFLDGGFQSWAQAGEPTDSIDNIFSR